MAPTASQQEREIPTGPRSISGGRKVTLYQSDGSEWYGPGVAPPSVVPADQPPRAWAFPFLWNASGDARSSKVREAGGYGFAEFEQLAKQVHVSAAIETVKNTQTKREWVFQLIARPGEQAADAALRATTDPRIAELSAFFESPDGEHDLAEWLRLLLDDLLIHDAPTLYNVQSNDGKPFELEVFAGATIKPLLDIDGRTPRGLGEEAYQQWLYGQPGEKFTRAEMMYSPRNPRPGKAFGRSPVEQLCFYINIALRKDLARLQTYTEGNIPAGMLPMPEGWSGDEILKWYASFNAFLQSVPENLIKLYPIPGGTGAPIFPALESNKDAWEDGWIRLVCFAFDIPLQSLVKELNRAQSESQRDTVEQDGQAGYTDWIRRLLNRIIRRWFGYIDIIAIPKVAADVEALTQAQIDDLELNKGTLQPNEKRNRMGRAPLKELDGKVGYFGPAGFVAFDAPPILPFGSTMAQEPTTTATPDAPTNTEATGVTKQPESQLAPSREFNGAQIAAVADLITKATKGDVPRDSGVSVFEVFFGLSNDEAERVMGSAGKRDVPTTPNPNPAAPDATPAADASKAKTRVVAMPKASSADVEKVLADFLKSQVSAAVRDATAYYETLTVDESKKADASVSIDWSELFNLIRPAFEKAYGKVGGEAYKSTGVSGPFDQLNKMAASYATQRAATLVGKQWVDGKLLDNPDATWAITSTTRDNLKALTEKAFTEGLSPDQLADQIEEMADFSAARAEMVARTEVANIQSAASVDAWKESGVVSKKRWLLAQDPCAVCIENADAGEIGLHENFPSGNFGPTAHPHCSCDVAAVVSEAA